MAQNLAVYRAETPLFEPFSFELLPGQAMQLTGANGSGKTTLLRCLCGLSNRYSGDIIWNEKSLNVTLDSYYANLLYLGHDLGLKPKLTVKQNLQFYRQMRFKEDSALILRALSQLNIDVYHNEQVGNLSAGQKRRVALSRLSSEPVGLWILDEPMVALDTAGQHWLEEKCNHHLANNGMIIFTSHQTVTNISGLKIHDLRKPNLEAIARFHKELP